MAKHTWQTVGVVYDTCKVCGLIRIPVGKKSLGYLKKSVTIYHYWFPDSETPIINEPGCINNN